MTDKEFADTVLEIATQSQCEFSPFVLPNEDGDCVEFFVSPNDYYAKRIDDYLTLYLDEESEDVVGFVIKNISRILSRVATQQADYAFVIRDGEVRLEALFTAMFFGDERRGTYIREYYKVVDIAQQHHLDRVRIPSILEKTHVPAKVSETIGA